jgi:hypothetical protein
LDGFGSCTGVPNWLAHRHYLGDQAGDFQTGQGCPGGDEGWGNWDY